MTPSTKHIKIAVDVRDLQIAASGTKTFLQELIKEFNKKNQDHSFIYLNSPRKVYTGKNILGKLFEHLKYFFWKQIELPYRVYKHKGDILFCSDFMVPYFQPGFKAIPVFHDAFFWEYPEHYNRIWLAIFRKLSVAAAKKSFCIVTPTQYSKKKIAAYTGIPLGKIEPIGEGPKPTLEKSPIDIPDKPYLLHVGTLEKRKNIINLIKACRRVIDKGFDIKLVLIGKASNKTSLDDSKNIDRLIDELDLKDHIIKTGYLPDEKVASYYTHASAYIFPSINEGFGIPVLESFLYKTPLLIANNSCLPEVAGEAAIQFDPYNVEEISNSIIKVLEDKSLRDQLIEKGSAQLKNYSWESTAQKLLNIFQEATK